MFEGLISSEGDDDVEYERQRKEKQAETGGRSVSCMRAAQHQPGRLQKPSLCKPQEILESGLGNKL
jgi:hypothetical protein